MASKKRYYDKAQENSDGAMIGNSSGPANMPQEVIRKNYPKNGSYLPENINDGLSGIDEQISSDVSGAKKNLSKTKY